jgi:CO/xanthine dehydrogenase Mo-binding subunit
VTGPYRIANYEATSRAVFTNTVPAGAFRGFSTSQVLWASESAMDEIARHVGEDPLEFRRRHLLREGEPYLGFDAPVDADLGSDLDEAARLIGSATRRTPGTGTGLALGVKDGGGGAARAAAHLRIHPDGSVEVHAGAAELGQGAQRVLARVAAEGLGVEVSRVEVRLGDTATAPFDRGTNASRTTVGVGMAVAKAAASARVALKVAWLADGGAKGSLRLDGADLVAGEDRRPMVDVLARGSGLPAREFPGLAVTGTHTDTQEEGSDFFPTLFYEVCATGVRVHVDRETGEIRVEHLASVVEAGHVLDEAGGHGQNVGAAMMGLGTSLTEELVYSQGELINANLIEYRVPTIAELPLGGITSVLVENAEGPGPGGAKGIGEAGIIAVAPALANAVEDAVGVRLRRLPLHPEAVWRALNQTAGSSPDERGR